MITEALKLGAALASVVEIKLRRKYKEKFMDLQDEYFKVRLGEKDKKGKYFIDMAKMDELERQITQLNLAMADEILGTGK